MYIYSNPERQNDKYALPDVEVFELTAEEVVAQDEELLREYSKKHEYRLANWNYAASQKMLAAIIEEQGITGGWFYQFCFPGCLPESSPVGPYQSAKAAIEAAQEEA